MKLVIDIPEYIIDSVKNDEVCHYEKFKIYEAVKNGIPLPKNYGDLIDRDELLKSDVGKIMGFRECDIRNAHTILEGSDKND